LCLFSSPGGFPARQGNFRERAVVFAASPVFSFLLGNIPGLSWLPSGPLFLALRLLMVFLNSLRSGWSQVFFAGSLFMVFCTCRLDPVSLSLLPSFVLSWCFQTAEKSAVFLLLKRLFPGFRRGASWYSGPGRGFQGFGQLAWFLSFGLIKVVLKSCQLFRLCCSWSFLLFMVFFRVPVFAGFPAFPALKLQ